MNPLPQKSYQFLLVFFAFLLTGCERESKWSIQVASPDQQWVAGARTTTAGGFGTGDIITSVYLTPNAGSKTPFEILMFDKGDPDLKMTWANPSHLDVTYSGQAVLWLQVARYGKVDIALHKVSELSSVP